MIPEKYRSLGGFALRSEKLNQEIADINLLRFLRFSKEQNLTINGLKLQGTFIVGKDRSVYIEEMYNTWKEKYETRTETIISSKDYKPGHKYKTPCGMEIIYLGVKYISKLTHYYDLNKSTKITKKHFCLNPNKPDILKSKVTTDLGRVISDDNIKRLFETYYEENQNITYFNDKPLKNPVYTIIEQNIKNIKRYSNRQYFCTLLCEADGIMYKGDRDTIEVCITDKTIYGAVPFTDKQYSRFNRSIYKNIKPLRIGVKNEYN